MTLIKVCEFSFSESDDSCSSFYTSIEHDIPFGFYLIYSKNKTPWFLPTWETNWNYMIEKILQNIGDTCIRKVLKS